MNFADLHCDTPYRAYHNSLDDLHVSPKKTLIFDKYTQVAAFWSDSEKSDAECYADFLKIYDNFMLKFKENICFSESDIKTKNFSYILSVEDLRIVEDKTERLYELYNKGIRLATLTWKDNNIIGGAWNTVSGLTEYGRRLTEEMLDIGIIPDVSHGNSTLLRDVFEICKARNKTFCATHSNSYSVCQHKRNLTDDDAKRIAQCGGIVGVSLCPKHLSEENSDIDTVIRHIDYYINLIGIDAVGFGCDFDGIDALPDGISDVSSMVVFYDKLSKKYGEYAAEKILYFNVYNYLLNNT